MESYEVTGSDDEINEPSKTRLANKGLLPEVMVGSLKNK